VLHREKCVAQFEQTEKDALEDFETLYGSCSYPPPSEVAKLMKDAGDFVDNPT
jgi:hypothetical protein